MELPEEQEQPLVHEITSDEATKQPSLADQLRARRTEIAESREVYLPITGYEEFGVFARHKLLEREDIERIGKQVVGETRDRAERNMRILFDTIIYSTVGFYLKTEDEEGYAQIQDDRHGDAHVTTWPEFAYYLGRDESETSNIRGSLYWVFGGNEFSIGQYGILLNRWMSNTGMKVDEDLLGEML